MVALVTTEWKLEWPSGHKWKWRQQKEPQKHIACRCCVFKYWNSSENSLSKCYEKPKTKSRFFFTLVCFKSYIPGTFRGHFLGGGLLRWVCLPGSGQLKFLPLISRLSHIPNCPTHPPAHLGKPSPSPIHPSTCYPSTPVSWRRFSFRWAQLRSDQLPLTRPNLLHNRPTCLSTLPLKMCHSHYQMPPRPDCALHTKGCLAAFNCYWVKVKKEKDTNRLLTKSGFYHFIPKPSKSRNMRWFQVLNAVSQTEHTPHLRCLGLKQFMTVFAADTSWLRHRAPSFTAHLPHCP